MNTHKQSSSSSRSRRALRAIRRARATRGAAMVEAAIVLPVLTLFLGLMMFVRAQYSSKLYVMADARQKAWDNAVHACVSGGEADSSLDVADPPGNTNQKIIQPGSSDGARQQGMVKVLRKTSAGASATTSVSRYSGTASSTSYVYCNEENYGEGLVGVLTGFVKFISSFWRTGIL